MVRALAMVSGGLDSLLAAKLIKDQGIEVIGICFKSYFFDETNAKKMCEQIKLPLEVIDFSEEHFEMVKNPKHGWGKNINPCIDCHAMMMKYSGDLLEKFNADFIITGEVLNQRPMSQNKKALETVKNESGFSNKILRPLCAQNLEPTEMELNGLVNREKLLKISGRSRTRQIELAKEWGIKDYPSPAGGCKLTEPNYAIRLKDLLNNEESIVSEDLSILKIGRHFRISKSAKVIATRDAAEAEIIENNFKKENDTILMPINSTGSMIILRGTWGERELNIAASICSRYCKEKDNDSVEIRYNQKSKNIDGIIKVKPYKDEELKEFIINA